MRWIYFLLLVIAAALLDTTAMQLTWLRTPLGPIAPMLLACVAVFVCLFERSGVEAALAGWALGIAADLTGSGPGMGLLALLYAAAAWGIFQIRTPFFCERAVTQLIMGFVFCAFVYEIWLAYQTLLGDLPTTDFGRRALQVLALSVYTAIVTPIVCALLKRGERIFFVPPSGGSRDRR